MRRLLLVLALLLPVRASADVFEALLSNQGGVDTVMLVFLLPYAVSMELDHERFSRFPYQNGKDWTGERSFAMATRIGTQTLSEGRIAGHYSARLRTYSGVGASGTASSWPAGSLHPTRKTGIYSLHMTANYLQLPWILIDAGFGMDLLDHPQRVHPQGGFSDELALEFFPIKPLTFHARYHGALLHGRGYNELSFSGGVTYKAIAVSAGYRALYSPWGQQQGPEITLQGWF